MTQKDHWEQTYETIATEKLGWFTPHLQTSLNWIKELSLTTDAPIIDVGGGASTLVGDLLEAGYGSITVLDVSEKALSSVKARLGKRAKLVEWLEGDITTIDLPAEYYDLWHDRAVFHFLNEPGQQRQYRDRLLSALKPGAHLIIGTFAPEAPARCSGLPVQRYSQERLANTLGGAFELIRQKNELHVTPGGIEQMYLYCHFRKMA
jgi:SAM-dependent methyltransferase